MLPFHPMALLLKHEGYPSGVIAATLVHGLLLFIIFYNPVMSNELVNLDEPVYINATTAEQNPQRLRRIQELELQRARDAEAQRQRERDVATQRAREEETRQQEAQRETDRLEQQRRERELAQRQQQEVEAEAQRQARIEQDGLERERQAQIAREQEVARQAELERQQALATQQAVADARAVDIYVAIIHNTVAGNWDIPPSARNGMTAVLAIRLVPTGEVISVNVIQSSGNAAFDRSVEQAIRRAERFPELQDMSTTLFESSFRNLTITFRPEDLLR
ncbi:MAG: protein TolA [SAR86 cluster bacterium]|uniref:Protein TolA n=1 Tax=SAR86 cluster bacterium TaxID=2030880 RepID=A0A2A5CFR1_9GAMM|nr:MAG: protein TolA [SAR86 cluster bacterium]